MKTNTYWMKLDSNHFTVSEKGWAELWTKESTWCSATWANPKTLQVISFVGEDATVMTAANQTEFVKLVKESKTLIDSKWNEDTIAAFSSMGLEGMLI